MTMATHTSPRVLLAALEMKIARRNAIKAQGGESMTQREARLDNYKLKGNGTTVSASDSMKYLQERYYDGGPIDYSAPRGGW